MAMTFIALDTNFLLYCTKQKIDLMLELERLCSFAYQLVVPQQVILELEKIIKFSKGKEKAVAELTLQMLNKLASDGKISVKRIKAENADYALIKLDKKDCIIATLDKELMKKLKNAKLLGIKQFKYLYFI